MSISLLRTNSCRLCGGNKFEAVLKLTSTPPADAYVSVEHLNQAQQSYPLEVFLCHSCGHLQLLDTMSRETICSNYIYKYSNTFGLAEHFQRYADGVLAALTPPQRSLVVDIGSNDGMLLRFFQNRGMRVLGVEPAFEAAREATALGIETIPAFFTAELAHKIKREYGAAVIINTSHMLANFDNPADMVEGLHSLLAVDGVFVAESFYLVDLIQNMVFDLIYHEHLSYYSVRPLQAFFRRHQMELINAERVDARGGSLRYTVQLLGGPREVSPSVASLAKLEADFGTDRPETFRLFAARIERAKKQLLGLLEDLKRQGKTIAGYGASATTTTLVYHFGLRDFLDYIVDDYVVRQNLFSPGDHIPVVSPQTIYEQKPDYLLILAWRYAEAIIEKHRAFLEQGGHFIVPLPKPRLV